MARPTRSSFQLTRRGLLRSAVASVAAPAAPAILRAQQPLTLDFLTIPDPDGWHPSLRLKGDWLVVAISDGRLTGYGEASHSNDDAACRQAATRLFAEHYRNFEPSLPALANREIEIAALAPDFVTATALSSINQALYDLLAKREQVPVWQLFRERPGIESLPLYTTINRALKERTREEYFEIVGEVTAQGFSCFKCAPFESVVSPDDAAVQAGPGLAILTALRERFPALALRVDFHERFTLASFREILPALESLGLDWIEEPFPMGADFTALKASTQLRVSAGELFWSRGRFKEIVDNAWADVIMPDVKHVGGFGALLDVMRMTGVRAEVSPHNPSGPLATLASLHAAAVLPDNVRSLEYAFDRAGSRRATGERVDGGRIYLSDAAGYGFEPAR